MRTGVALSDRERAALKVLAEQEKPQHPARIGYLIGDRRPSFRVGHSWRNTLFALERKGLVRVTYPPTYTLRSGADFSITDAGREAIA